MARSKKKIIIVGGGPGGVTSAMLLASRGFDVSLFEKKQRLGGRNGFIQLGDYRFDVGPTFLMMKFLLDSIFEEAEGHSENYLQFTKLSPMYELCLGDKRILFDSNPEITKNSIEKHFPGLSSGYDRFMINERKRFKRMIPCIQRDYSRFYKMMAPSLMAAVPYLSLFHSVYQVLKKYFKEDDLALLFSFQSKYLGMSAWHCPGAFSMLSYIEHAYGIYHTQGGLSELSESIGRAAQERGAKIHLGCEVKKILLEGRKVTGVELVDGEKVYGDEIIINADFAHAMATLIDPNQLRSYRKEKLDQLRYSCSTFMLYLALDKIYDLPHHTIVFARKYKRNVEEIFEREVESQDISFYVRNASINDPTLAPKGKSGLYVLVPTPNLNASIDWKEAGPRYRTLTLNAMKNRLGLEDLEKHIVAEKVIDPMGWRDEYDVYKGATFNLAHNLGQMAYFRPHNQFEEFENCYLAGGGTHPGSGLPTIFESARIAANLISRKHNVNFITQELILPGD